MLGNNGLQGTAKQLLQLQLRQAQTSETASSHADLVLDAHFCAHACLNTASSHKHQEPIPMKVSLFMVQQQGVGLAAGDGNERHPWSPLDLGSWQACQCASTAIESLNSSISMCATGVKLRCLSMAQLGISQLRCSVDGGALAHFPRASERERERAAVQEPEVIRTSQCV